MKISFKLLFLLFSVNLSPAILFGANTITGKVVERATKSPVPFVNIFLANTTIGTTSDENGNFVISNAPSGRYDLVFRHIGYDVHIQPAQLFVDSRLVVNVKLELHVFKGEEIYITAEIPKEWKKILPLFTEAFLGETKNVKHCKIVNPEVLSFQYDKDSKVYEASADSILIVENKYLGYTLFCTIVSFCWSERDIRHRVYTLFQTLTSFSDKQKSNWEGNRKETFWGSPKHFFSAFYSEKVYEEGFVISKLPSLNIKPNERVRKIRIPPDDYQEFLTDTSYFTATLLDSQKTALLKTKDNSKKQSYKKMYFDNWIRIEYRMSFEENCSFLNLKGYGALVDSLGNLMNMVSIEEAGDWGASRFADRLPLDYFPPN